ncbi:aminopeptidase P family protein [Ktedonosporobacter rubrisoli]|uniref:Aminopeptidase P family protein n=1 Tax=Ktedonosporobacter rubrisoli TaxID=2509675 RepID=A0A4P6JST0_KTERU|nr:Xaa-Pro peptidase family protein [Ktedonosporobacter rubrisoli]QBD78320.1 aminopeptidase P family protein [Ktedonosporobacter rubrisoli]
MNNKRAEHLKTLFAHHGADYHAIISRTPQSVLMLSGYQPILGNSFCVVSPKRDGNGHPIDIELRLAVPKDEEDLVPPGTALEVKTFTVETMHSISSTTEAVREPLGELLLSLGIDGEAVFGYEGADEPIATGYTQVGVPGPETLDLLHSLRPGDFFRNATEILNELAAIKADEELAAIRQSEAVAYQGFAAAREAIRVGATEADVAAATYAALLRAGYATPGAHHVQPHVHVMAGPRAALAYRAFNLTSNATIHAGDTVTVQMEIALNGYWAELTRTFFAGSISEEWRKAHQACMAAQDAALKVICDGVEACDVDNAARSVMRQAGFGPFFKHGLGHGFGFQAINHAATPVLHPASHTILRAGMVHNMEPAVYIDGKGGLRLNDNVAVLPDGHELLSSRLPRDIDWLVVNN